MPETDFILLLSIGLIGLISIHERPAKLSFGLSKRNFQLIYQWLKGDRINHYFRPFVVLIVVVMAGVIYSIAFADKFTDTIGTYKKSEGGNHEKF